MEMDIVIKTDIDHATTIGVIAELMNSLNFDGVRHEHWIEAFIRVAGHLIYVLEGSDHPDNEKICVELRALINSDAFRDPAVATGNFTPK